MNTVLSARNLHFAYNGRPVLAGISFDLAVGEFLGLVGPNGAGKSTLLRLLLGILKPGGGEARLRDEPLGALPRAEVARRTAFLPQGAHADFAFTVREVVAMGRTPYLGRFRPEGPEDREAIRRAMEQTETAAMADRLVTELSGGERQRVFLARAFAQTTPLLLLDEPNANLDLLHAFQLVDLVQGHVRRGAAVIAALHDLNLAARVCDRILVLKDGAVAALGPPAQVLTTALLASVFGVKARVGRDEEGHLLVSVLGPALEAPPS